MSENNAEYKRVLCFHLGLAKTGSTYLQNKFFNKLKGLKYIHTSKFYKYDTYIHQYKDDSLLFSREFDRQFDRETKKIAEKYPDAKIIIVLRSNEEWIASQYKRYVKNGGSMKIEKFLDIENDNGPWKIKDAEFIHRLKLLKSSFLQKPLIIFYDDFKNDPWSVFDKIAAYTNSTYDREKISLRPKHSSYSDKQLLFLRKRTKRLYKKGPYRSDNKKTSWLAFRSRWLILHVVLWLAALLPVKYSEKLISEDSLKKYKEFFNFDWQACKQFAEQYSA